jgi:hypothetical protein
LPLILVRLDAGGYMNDANNQDLGLDPFGATNGSPFASFEPPSPAKGQSRFLRSALFILVGIAGLAISVTVISSMLTPAAQQTASAPTSVKGDPVSPPQEDQPNALVEPDDPTLSTLNAAGSLIWRQDPFKFLGKVPPAATYISSAGPDGSTCTLWIYASYGQAGSAAQSSDFANMNTGLTWGASNDNSIGYVLVADNQETYCAVQALRFLGL